MVFGRVGKERIQFNESTLWTGEPHDYAHKGAAAHLNEIRQLLFDGTQKEAEALAMKVFMSDPIRQNTYQAFGDLNPEFPDAPAPTSYRRDLNLSTAVATTEYTVNGVTYRREVISSWPAQAILVRLTASKPGSLTFTAALQSAHQNATLASASDREITMAGPVEESAIRYEARLLAQPDGGTITSKDGAMSIKGANAVTLILTGATNFKNYRDVSADPVARNKATLAPLRSSKYALIRANHVTDYQRLYNRVNLDLGVTAAAEQPTDERIRNFATGNDPQLVTMLFQYGRYLLISASRPGGQPATLQGLWNDSNKPSWDSKYTVNINTEMNYWPAEVTALNECSTALFDALKEVAEAGARTAKEQYNARGWVLHHNFDLWRGTAPINASNHGIWPSGGAWLSQALWDHYLFTHDRDFLRNTAYPLMKGAALFFVDTLVPNPMDGPTKGRLITGPSNSPEQGGLVMGPTMDHQIVRGLFEDVIAASRILNTDADLRAQLTDLRKKIAPNQIGKHGQLQEWLPDVDDPNNHHRHVSHLWGVFPGREITPLGTPELFAAAKKSLEFRGDEATGWSMGWKVNLWAHFLDGAHAYRILQNLIVPASNGDRAKKIPSHAGLFANMFDAHPPFQIDGNFGAASGVAEMLLQSDDWRATPTSLTDVQLGKAAQLNLLPALPPQFATGEVKGLMARGALTVDLAWDNGKLTRAVIRAKDAIPVQVRYAGKEVSLDAKAGGVYMFGPDLAR
jgi:alpha-L-fucosidase 2